MKVLLWIQGGIVSTELGPHANLNNEIPASNMYDANKISQ